jgi:hypothetical protein
MVNNIQFKWKKHNLYNTIKIHCTETKESQVVQSATEVNKTRGQWFQLHSKPNGDEFGGGGGWEWSDSD